MSSITRKPKKLERWRAKPQQTNPVAVIGKGRADVRAAKAIVARLELAAKKEDGKAVRDLIAQDLDALKTQLEESRKELFTLRFKHATSQLENVALIATTKKRIARILTLMKQKEVGA